MAVLSETDRQRVWRGVMRYWCNQPSPEPTPFTKAQFRAAVDATDDWIDGNGAASSTSTGYNSVLPAAFRNGASTAQKTLLFCAVACMRVSVAFARQVLGEVD